MTATPKAGPHLPTFWESLPYLLVSPIAGTLTHSPSQMAPFTKAPPSAQTGAKRQALLPGDIGEQASLTEASGHRLLAADVEPLVEGGEGLNAVPVVGRRDHHRVEFFRGRIRRDRLRNLLSEYPEFPKTQHPRRIENPFDSHVTRFSARKMGSRNI